MGGMKRSVQVAVPAEEASIAAVVIRCGCPPGEMDHEGAVCWRPRAEEDLGVIAYSHRNPLRTWWWEIRQAWKEGRRGR
jgi:hypothetical protein